MVAYIAAVASHEGYTDRFRADLTIPGVRIPLTRNAKLWTEAVELGREVVWLYTYGERYVSSAEGRPETRPRLPDTERPKVVTPIPDDEEGMPEEATYDPATETLHVGRGAIRPVPASTWEFDISGFKVAQRWIRRRVRDPEGARQSPLDQLIPQRWTIGFTTELLDLLNVIGRLDAIAPRQSDLLDRVLNESLISLEELTDRSLLPVPADARKPPNKPKMTEGTLFEQR